jgi:CHAD domain-containing protein
VLACGFSGDDAVAHPRGTEDRTATLLRDRVKRVFRELPGAVAGEDEPVHQIRVAGRRLRVSLPLLARRGGGRRVRRVLKTLRQLVGVVGEGRDLYVEAGLFEDRLGALKSTSPEQRALLAMLRRARSKGRRRVTESVLDLDIGELRRELRGLLARGPADAATVLARVRALREQESAEMLRAFSRIGERYLPEALHALRRGVRRLRYAAEVEDAVRGDDSRAPVLWKRLQDGIGTLHDHHVLACWLEEQAKAAEARGNLGLATAARHERRFFVSEGRRLHKTLLETKPADLALRALQAMARGGPIAPP